MDKEKDYKQTRAEKYKIDSRDRLAKILKKKIQTTMIGSLSTIEDAFGFLWGKDKPESELTEQEKQMAELYQEVRSDILDKGNTQVRNTDVELSQYDVEWKKYSMKLPVRPGKRGNENE